MEVVPLKCVEDAPLDVIFVLGQVSLVFSPAPDSTIECPSSGIVQLNFLVSLRPRSHYDNDNDNFGVTGSITFALANTCGHTQKMDPMLLFAISCVMASTTSLLEIKPATRPLEKTPLSPKMHLL